MAKMVVTNGASPFRPRLRFGPMRARENSWGVSNLAERELARLKLTHPIQRGEQITEAQPLQDTGQVKLSDIDHTNFIYLLKLQFIRKAFLYYFVKSRS